MVDLEKMTCVCPAGQVTSNLVKAGYYAALCGNRIGLHKFRFSSSVCNACPLRSDCFRGKDRGHGREIQLHPHEGLLQAARDWQGSPDFDLFRKDRQVVEHRLARLVQLGMRQARYFGRKKTLFQLLMTAAVANLTLIAGSKGSPLSGPGDAALRLVFRGLQGLLSTLHRTLQTSVSRPITSVAGLRLSAVPAPFRAGAFA